MGTIAADGAPGVRAIYVEFGRDRSPLAWFDGRLLADDDSAARERIHLVFARTVTHASADKQLTDLRAVRSRDTLLVEFRVDSGDANARIDAAVLMTRPAHVDWASAAAQVAWVLHDGGVAADESRLQANFAEAWRRTHRGGRLAVALAAASAVLVLIWRSVKTRRNRGGAPSHPRKERYDG